MKILTLLSLLLFSGVLSILKLPTPEKLFINDPLCKPCSDVEEINKNSLFWNYTGTPPWKANLKIRVFRSVSIVKIFKSLLKEEVPGLNGKTFQEVFSIFQQDECLMYPHGGTVRDFFLKLPPKDIDVEFSCSPETLSTICIAAFGLENCHVSGTYFYLGKTDTTSKYDELEGVNWNTTVFGPLWTKEFTTNTLSYDLINDAILDFSGAGVIDTCKKFISIPTIQSEWNKWLFEHEYFSQNGLKKLPRYWKLRATPKNYRAKDQITANFIINHVTLLWKDQNFNVQNVFRQFYCTFVNGTVKSDGCYFESSISPEIQTKIENYNSIFAKDMGFDWYYKNIVQEGVNSFVQMKCFSNPKWKNNNKIDWCFYVKPEEKYFCGYPTANIFCSTQQLGPALIIEAGFSTQTEYPDGKHCLKSCTAYVNICCQTK